MVSIEVHDFHKSYGATAAVQGISFRVEPGAILGLVGPNGAGKTTTLRTLAGILTPTRGKLTIAGHDLVREAVAAKAVLAFVPDEPHLFESLTVWDHLRFIAAAYRVRDWEPRAEVLLEQFDLVEKRRTPAAELSRGMRQKVAICCGYLHDPKAILLDEPLTGLDPHGIRTMQDSIRGRARAGAAFIVSSHLLALVEDLCTHLLVLHRGRIVLQGSIEELRGRLEQGDRGETLEELFFRMIAAPPPPEPAAIEPAVRS
jgi:ABC-2 type transport system ATP-binding protein